jgi:hypothetical protein
MKTLTTIQALATLAALGSVILGSATPADARGGGNGFAGHASFARPSFARPSFARPSFGRPLAGIAARQQPPAVIAAQLAHPGHVNSGSTSMIANTPNGPVFVPPKQPPAVTAAQLANPGHVNSGSTSMIANTPNGPVFVPPKQPPATTPGQPRPPEPR